MQQYDDVKIGIDSNADGDILDAGDDIQASDDFGSNVMSLSYDNNGNLTDDGVYHFVYDAWNRLRQAQRVAAGDTTTFGTYSYYADTRGGMPAKPPGAGRWNGRSGQNSCERSPRGRAGMAPAKVVEHCGPEAVANDGGDQTVYFGSADMPARSVGVGQWDRELEHRVYGRLWCGRAGMPPATRPANAC